MKKLLVTMFAGLLLATCFNTVYAQSKVPDLSKINDPKVWTLHNREILDDEVVHLNGQPGDGPVFSAPVHAAFGGLVAR